ncbi:hypothetical protein ACFO5Q_10385 [Kordiimonas lipolytica]|uniref:Uncharacterized protein n=1 Tax=Kordiimonas lipolytica TaxID=1662421 RepID=A0ABV8UBE8_9PROT|nr:hypothetical protein [Kordiimonas lipolytica]
MYEHDWHWKRAILAGFVAPLGSATVVGLFYWLISNLIVLLGQTELEPSSINLIAGFFLEAETLFSISLGVGVTGLVLMMVLGVPLGYGISKFPRFSKPAYILASFLAFLVMLIVITDGDVAAKALYVRDVYFLGYFAMITLLNGWIAHLIVHGKRKRPPVRVETVFE